MKRRTFLWSATLSLLAGPLARAKDDQRIGALTSTEFKTANEAGAARVKAVVPVAVPLSEADHQLVAKLTMAGLFQLQASQWALPKIQSTDLKVFAAAEVDEQRGLSAKLKELSAAKGFTVPLEPGGEQKKILQDLMAMSMPVDREYLKLVGVDGHQALQTIMEEIRAKAVDPNLKQLAAAALPLVGTHLTLCREELEAE
jgi:putative membrane protein